MKVRKRRREQTLEHGLMAKRCLNSHSFLLRFQAFLLPSQNFCLWPMWVYVYISLRVGNPFYLPSSSHTENLARCYSLQFIAWYVYVCTHIHIHVCVYTHVHIHTCIWLLTATAYLKATLFPVPLGWQGISDMTDVSTKNRIAAFETSLILSKADAYGLWRFVDFFFLIYYSGKPVSV